VGTQRGSAFPPWPFFVDRRAARCVRDCHDADRRAVTEPDLRARSGNHIDRDSKFPRALPTVTFRAGTLPKRLLDIASTMYIYVTPYTIGSCLAKLYGGWRVGARERKLNGQKLIPVVREGPMRNRQSFVPQYLSCRPAIPRVVVVPGRGTYCLEPLSCHIPAANDAAVTVATGSCRRGIGSPCQRSVGPCQNRRSQG